MQNFSLKSTLFYESKLERKGKEQQREPSHVMNPSELTLNNTSHTSCHQSLERVKTLYYTTMLLATAVTVSRHDNHVICDICVTLAVFSLHCICIL